MTAPNDQSETPNRTLVMHPSESWGLATRNRVDSASEDPLTNEEILLIAQNSELTDLPLVRRFLRKTWGIERIAIDAMKPGEVLTFPASQYNNIRTSVDRLNDAYEGTRIWKLTTAGLASTVTYSEP